MPAPYSCRMWLTRPDVSTLPAEGEAMAEGYDTSVERNLLHAALDRLALRNRARGLPPQAKDAAFKVMEAVALLEQAGGGQEEGGVCLFQKDDAGARAKP